MPPSTALEAPAALSLDSSVSEIDAELRRMGVFYYSHHYVKDREFEQYVLTPRLKSMGDVHLLLDSLDIDNQNTDWKGGCTKAITARERLKYDQTVTSELSWALHALARTRRTCCGCHETGSFKAI